MKKEKTYTKAGKININEQIKNIFSENPQIKIICGLVVAICIIIGICVHNITKENEGDYFFSEENETEENIVSVNEIEENTNTEIVESIIQDEQSNYKKQIIVHVTGQVINEGIVIVKEGARVFDAIEAAGGATEQANLALMNLAYILEDGMKIYVPSIKDNEESLKNKPIITKGGESQMESLETGVQENLATLKININTATINELIKLPGIGNSIAMKIIEYRNEIGKFKSIEDLKNVSGIGDAKFKSIKKYVYV